MRSPNEPARPREPTGEPIEQGCFANVRGGPQWITLRGADAPRRC
jgi:hypothetical protein